MSRFSRLISGTMTWGDWGKKLRVSEQTSLFENLFELGITTFDHADIYGHYTSEALFGKAFEASQIERDQIQLISKCGIQLPCDRRPLKVQHYDYSLSHIEKSVSTSLHLLKTDYLDLLLLHRPSPLMVGEEIAEAIHPLLKDGKILAFGVSNFTPSQMSLMQQEFPLSWNQIECSVTHNTPLFDGTLDFMQTHQIGIMAWGALGSYFKEKSPSQKRVTTCLAPMIEKYEGSEAALLLAWLLKHPAKIYPVLGSTEPQRWKAMLKALQIELDLQDWFLILEAATGKPIP